jgi:hypothetical protein
MRDIRLLGSALTLGFALGCDSGESSAPSFEEPTSNAAGNTVSTTAAQSATSTTGSPTTGSGLVYDTGMGCTPGVLATSQTLYGRWDKALVTIDGLQYFLQVNQWNEASTGMQTMQVGTSGFLFKMTAQSATAPTNGGPTGFPSVFIGTNSNNGTQGSNLPKQVSSLTGVPTKWVWKDAGTLADKTANSYNAAYDVWFSQGADGEPSAYHPSGAFLMVWYHKPSDAQPIGSVKEQAATIPGVPGQWNVWTGANNGTPIVSYVATQTISSMDFDLMDFIRHAIARGDSVQNSHYLTNVFAGFEIWRGGVNVETTSFCAEVI